MLQVVMWLYTLEWTRTSSWLWERESTTSQGRKHSCVRRDKRSEDVGSNGNVMPPLGIHTCSDLFELSRLGSLIKFGLVLQ